MLNLFRVQFLPFSFCLCLLFASCAIRQQPEGGKKDINPPKIKLSIPGNYSTNFKAKEIRIEFDEYIDLKELSNQLVISPLMPKDPEVTIKSKTLIIKLPDSLKQNTTYTLNFGNAIIDTHEANAVENFQYVFSTGPVLDSLEVNGEVKFAENLKIEKGIVVMLYNNANDTVVFNTLPDYFAKTDSAGKFLIKNLRAGNYKLFALKDANANYKFDSKTEAIAFSNQLIRVPDTAMHLLKLFVEPDTLPHVLKAQYVSPHKMMLLFTASVSDFQLKLLSPSAIENKNLLFEKNATMDSIYIYSTDTLADSLHAVIYNGGGIVDTIDVNLKPLVTQKGRGTGTTAIALEVTANIINNILELPANLSIGFSVPLQSFDYSKLMLTKDSLIAVDYKVEQSDSLKKKYHISFKAEENKSYRLLMLPNAATDIFNHHNDTAIFSFRTREDREYANVLLNFTTVTPEFNYIIQMLTENDLLTKEIAITKNQKVTFEHVLPGKYKIRIIADTNKNGKWDTGNYAHHIQPENVFYYPEIISTRSNWDVDLNWILK